MDNMIGIFMQCVVDRIEEVYDIYMSILYDSMTITILFILRVVTIKLLPRIVLILVPIIEIYIIMYITIIKKMLELDTYYSV